SPPSQSMVEMIGNFGEVVWQGANGIVVEPEPEYQFGAQAIFKVDRDEWAVFDIPKELDQWVKISFSCQVDGKISVPPDHYGVGEIGWVVGCGDTIEDSVDALREHIEEMPECCHVQFNSIADLLKKITEAEDAGMEFTDQEIPDPAITL